MALYALINRARFSTPTTGNGLSLSIGSAVPGYITLSGLPEGSVVGYSIEEGTNFETGTGIYHTAGTLDRQTVETSSAGAGTRITLAGSATCFVTITAAMMGGKSLAFQQSDAAQITAGQLGVVSTEVWQVAPVLEPDLLHSFRDATGAIGFAFDVLGVTHIASINVYGGTIAVSADPTQPLQVTSKQYVDARVFPLSNTIPNMAGVGSAGTGTTVTRGDHTHPADLSRAPIDQPLFTTQIGLANSGETWTVGLEPDFLWVIADTDGDIGMAMDYTGLLMIAQLSVVSLVVTGTITLSGPLGASQITVSQDIWQDAGLIPDLIGTVRGTDGNIIAGYDTKTGEFNVVAINAAYGMRSAGKPIVLQNAPSDAIDITSTVYGAVGDGRENYTCFVTTSGNTLSINNFTGLATLVQLTDPTKAQITCQFPKWSGWAFQWYMTGADIHIVNTDTGYVLDATITKYLDGFNLEILASGVTAFTNANITVVCPPFRSTDIGKWLILEGMGKGVTWLGPTSQTKTFDANTTYGYFTWMGQIATVNSATSVTFSGTAFPFNWTNKVSRIRWGTNDGAAVTRAARDAFNAGMRKIWFPGGINRLYMLVNLTGGGPGRWSYLGAVVTPDPNILFNGVLWFGDGARAHVCDATGVQFKNQPSQVGAVASRMVEKRIHGRATLKRCAQLSTINLLVTGDSQGTFNPESQAAAVMPGSAYVKEFIAQNPGKVVKVYNIAIGGATYQSFASPANLVNNNSNPVQYWTVPKPVSGTWKWSDFLTNINRTGTGPAIVPDVVIFMNCGGNDSWTLDMLSFLACINLVKTIPHADGFGPTDLILQTDEAARIPINANTQDSTLLPDGWNRLDGWEYATTMQRGVALNRGYGILDQVPIIQRACWGVDATHRGLRAVLAQSPSLVAGQPWSMATQCRDLSFWMTFPAANDLAAWQAMQEMSITLSETQTNRFMLRLGPNNNFWYATSSQGKSTSTVVTMTAGLNTLQVGDADYTYTGDNYFFYRWRQMGFGNNTAPGTPGTAALDGPTHNGRCVIGNFGNGGNITFDLTRNYIRQVVDPNNAIMFEVSHDSGDTKSVAKPVWIGGQQFVPIDAVANTDVWMVFADGTIFQTQITGYTDRMHVTMRDVAPQTLAGVAVDMFVGIMGIPWTDSGIPVPATTNTGVLEIGFVRNQLSWGFSPDMLPVAVTEIDFFLPLEKFGNPYNPVFRVTGTVPQVINLTNIYVDEITSYQPSCTPWELRSDASADTWMYSGGGHSGSRFRTEVIDHVIQNVNFSTV